MKKAFRRKKRMYVESKAKRTEEAVKRSDVRTLYEITRRLSGFSRSTCKLVRNKAGVLVRIVEEEMHWWRKHFERVANHEAPKNPLEVAGAKRRPKHQNRWHYTCRDQEPNA